LHLIDLNQVLYCKTIHIFP